METDIDRLPIESHPWQPFIPDKARVLIMGTFPPKSNRWSMDFYYPNKINDFWRVMGLAFYDNPDRFWNGISKSFRLKDIKDFLTERGIAMNDTGSKVRRLKDNASDKYLEIVEPVNLEALLNLMPDCRAIATTGEKAAGVIASITGTGVPQTGSFVETEYLGRKLTIWRMPSTSRAYPLPVAKKAEAYAGMFRSLGIL
ncbi:MAG: uracil-DNA glycosylase family protein [Paramuribaculum sp.]|nr:uracil-DNA glycosylase family protein [Paramuribaculum sp.]